jgi:SAM-dependent methyltransferase
MPSVDWNRQAWGVQHEWAQEGDEWAGMAEYCGQPYEAWKSSLSATFIEPYATDADVLEIAPGHGRWTELIARGARSVTLVDINQSCLDACRERFGDLRHLTYHLGDGVTLPVPDASADFVWSFDSFVHMDPPVVYSYVREISRVLRIGGTAIVHHADKRPWSLALVPLTARFGKAGRVVQQVASQGRLRGGGWRSHITGEMVARWALESGLDVVKQTRSWGERGEYDVRRFRDLITVMTKSGAPRTDMP